jgi:hypothetical protein
VQHWRAEQALEEMREYHFKDGIDGVHLLSLWRHCRVEIRGMSLPQALGAIMHRLGGKTQLRAYVESFPRQLRADPRLHALYLRTKEHPVPSGHREAESAVTASRR